MLGRVSRAGSGGEVGVVSICWSGMLTFDEEKRDFTAFGCLFELIKGIHKLSIYYD